jgi:NAD-dependent SIR2 family protein deacetylase
VPHEGFAILHAIAANMRNRSFIFTSNVDGQFQKARFSTERIIECHGSIHHLQCLDTCTNKIWLADELMRVIDTANCRMISDLPHCPHCGGLTRPNILMFNDSDWIPDRTEKQDQAFDSWLRAVKNPVVIEIGAGTNIPSVRRQAEALDAPLIRINPAAPEVPGAADIGLAMSALSGLQLILQQLK